MYTRRDWKVVVGREQRCRHLDSEHETDDEATWIVSAISRNFLGTYC